MPNKAFFNDIHSAIFSQLLRAEKKIQIAMCYFTDKRLLNLLSNKAFSGVKVELLIDGNHTNNKMLFGFAAQLGCKLYMLDKGRLMHNKFCIVDDKVLITGSYNWTNSAKGNFENIIILKKNSEPLISAYSDEFSYLKSRALTLENDGRLAKENIFLTELIRNRKGLYSYRIDERKPFWIANRHSSSAWITERDWNPSKGTLIDMAYLAGPSKANHEPLLLKKYPYLGILNDSPIALKTSCKNCELEIIVSWFKAHQLNEHSCPECGKEFSSNTNLPDIQEAA